MSERIKRGDNIRCINDVDTHGGLKHGRVYTAACDEDVPGRAQDVFLDGLRGGVRVEEDPWETPWQAHRFVVVERAPLAITTSTRAEAERIASERINPSFHMMTLPSLGTSWGNTDTTEANSEKRSYILPGEP